MELTLSRYILEIQKDVSLFKKYEHGWYPNIDEYGKFLHKQEKNNENFSKLIERYHLVKNNHPILETVMSNNIDSVSTYLKKDAKHLITSYGTIQIPYQYPEIAFNSYYISNGIYEISEKLALEVYSKSGKFIIGVCDNPDAVFYQENIARLKEIEKVLRKRNINYDKLTHNNHRDKCVILASRNEVL